MVGAGDTSENVSTAPSGSLPVSVMLLATSSAVDTAWSFAVGGRFAPTEISRVVLAESPSLSVTINFAVKLPGVL